MTARSNLAPLSPDRVSVSEEPRRISGDKQESALLGAAIYGSGAAGPVAMI
jgi:hypothetical protein